MLGLNGGSNGVAKVDLGDLFLRMRENCAELAFSFDLDQLLHVFHVFFIGFGVPEDYAELYSVCFLVTEHQDSVGKVAPLVVRSDCSHVDVGTCCDCDPQACALPSDVIDCLSVGDSEVFEVVSLAVEEFHNCSFLLVLQGASCNC